MNKEIANRIASMKGLAGSGNILSNAIEHLENALLTLEPGDMVRTRTKTAVAAPVAYDLWYLYYNVNLMQKFYDLKDINGIAVDFRYFDFTTYLNNNLGFLSKLAGLKPLKVLTDLDKQLSVFKPGETEHSYDIVNWNYQYKNNGIYWINLMAFELRIQGLSLQYVSDQSRPGTVFGSKGFNTNPNDYVGYLAFPIGQLGVMEVVSLLQETDLEGYQFKAVDSSADYLPKAAPVLDDKDQPSLQTPPQVFPDMKIGNKILAGKNFCFGRHLIESAYLVPATPVANQNKNNSEGRTAYAPTPSLDVELWAASIKDYNEDIKPKKWMRYWIHKDSTLPVPGEFIGILTRAVAAPPHVWWFQESNPFLYAGNWVETRHFTSGIITKVTLEKDRGGATGNLYKIRVQGCEIQIAASDFLVYSVGDRVAVLKMKKASPSNVKTSSLTPMTASFTFLDETYLKESDGKKTGTNTDYIIIPITFYRKIH